MTEATFALEERITVRDRGGSSVSGRVVQILRPDAGARGSRVEGGSYVSSSYSGGYCREHRRPNPHYEGDPTIAPTLPHYTILTTSGAAVERCACQVMTEAKAVTLFDIGPGTPAES